MGRTGDTIATRLIMWRLAMTYDPGNPGEQPQPPAGQGWSGGQQPPYPGAYGQQQPPPGWGPPPGQPGYGGAPTSFGPTGSPQTQAKGFFTALFDFGFTSFATPSVVKVIYVVGMVILGLVYVVAVIAGFTQGVGPGLLALIGGGIIALLYLTLFRITLEFYYAVIRMSEDIHHRR
jgi:hypothetical protein